MSLLEGGASGAVTLDYENNGTVNPDSVQTVQNTNAPSCDVEDTGNDSELLKGLLTDTFCQVCEAVLLFESQRVSHYEGKKHAQKVRIYLQTKKAERIKQSQANSSFQSGNVNPEKFCELCNMVFSSPVVAKSHYEGKVHAKNMRKNDTTPSTDMKTTAVPVSVPVAAQEGAAEAKADQEQKESPDSPTQEVNLNDPDKYCKLCTASFNNPVMAQQHYSGRKHQRNQARQEMLGKLSSESDNANTLTCPVCCVTLSSAETYQAHMQGNKHFVKEKKIVGLCKSQKKVYDSFQDELADYIQVQKSRGLEPKTKAEEELDEGESFEEEPQIVPPLPPPSSCLPPPPPLFSLSSFRPQWRPPFQPRTGHFGFRGRFPMQSVQHQWGRGYPPHPPPLIPGLTGRSFRRGRSPDSFSSSSSDSSSYSSSSSGSSISSSDSGSDSSSDRRRRRRRNRKERMKRRRRAGGEQDDDSNKDERRRSSKRRQRGRQHEEEEEEEGHTKKAKREKRMSFEEEQGTHEEKERRKRKEKRHREGDSSEEDEHRTKRRLSKKDRREKEGRYGKRRWEEDEGEKEVEREEGGEQTEGVQGSAVEPTEERTELRGEEKSKRRKEKKKVKEKTDEGDKRTEEEKLWDETILGIF